ncbi:unnamed protein product [Parnassius mnemosyne]|uniref:Uncharacterized protein n=1 Tax=Parnassius mnemosyne TaxID=213953 RepID=A0AAV1KM66_9NEOP
MRVCVCRVCARGCADATLRARLLEAAAALADLLLAAHQQHQHHHHHQLAALRRDLIRPYVEIGQGGRAGALAEKFEEWEVLVQLCVDAGDLPRLHALIDKYAHEVIFLFIIHYNLLKVLQQPFRDCNCCNC